jgi:TatD DNase family protein
VNKIEQCYIDIHSHLLQQTSDIVVYNNFSEAAVSDGLYPVFFSSGTHPWYLNNWEYKTSCLLNKINDPRMIAIGECGLDTYSLFPKQLQQKVFSLHIDLSETYQKPLIVHCVKSFHDLFQIRKKYHCSMPWVIHGFSSNMEIAQKCISYGMFLSFGKLLFQENSHAVKVAANIPLANVLLETDESKSTISDIYARFSTIRELDISELKNTIASNFNNCFNL